MRDAAPSVSVLLQLKAAARGVIQENIGGKTTEPFPSQKHSLLAVFLLLPLSFPDKVEHGKGGEQKKMGRKDQATLAPFPGC